MTDEEIDREAQETMERFNDLRERTGGSTARPTTVNTSMLAPKKIKMRRITPYAIFLSHDIMLLLTTVGPVKEHVNLWPPTWLLTAVVCELAALIGIFICYWFLRKVVYIPSKFVRSTFANNGSGQAPFEIFMKVLFSFATAALLSHWIFSALPDSFTSGSKFVYLLYIPPMVLFVIISAKIINRFVDSTYDERGPGYFNW
jgi:hypothetical protein